MANIVVINTHEASDKTAESVERRHYTVAALIAELQRFDGSAEVVVKNLNTGTFGSIDFQGVAKTA